MAESGFDVSKWQEGLYSGGGGFTFGLAKASEGNGFKDPYYDRHLAAIKAHGLVPGAYHFSRPDLGNTAEGEADWFLRVVGDPRGMLLALDLEVGSGNLASYRDRFCDRVQAKAGKPCWWYSYGNFVSTRSLNTSSADYPFWLAWPDANGALPGFAFGGVAMQQYGLTSVPGIPGGVDANRFFGSVEQLRALAIGGAVPAAPAAPVISPPGGEGSMVTLTGANGRIHRLIVSEGDPDPLGHPGGPVHWVALDGGPGGLDGWQGGDGALPGGGGWIAAGTLAATIWTWTERQRELLVVQGRGPDGRIWRKALYTDDFSVEAEWKAISGPSPAVPGAVPIPGPAGPPGPAVTDEHIVEVAVAEIKKRLES